MIEITFREQEIIEYLREISIPFGEMVIRFSFQDRAIVRAVLEDNKPSRKFIQPNKYAGVRS